MGRGYEQVSPASEVPHILVNRILISPEADAFSPQYSDNGYGGHCGASIWICNNDNGACADATVVDECPTCNWGSLDLSTGLFGHLTNGVS